MRKLLKSLNKWYKQHPIVEEVKLNKWQRDIIYEFIIEYIKGVKENNG